MCICAYYQRLAPDMQLTAVLKGEALFQELWLFLRVSWGKISAWSLQALV